MKDKNNKESENKEKSTEVKTEEEKSKNEYDNHTLFIRCIPKNVKDEELINFFSKFAPVKHGIIVKNQNEESKEFGFMTFVTQEDALDALVKSKKTIFHEKFLKVEFAKRRNRNKMEDNKESKKKKDSVLIVRNLSWKFKDPNELKKHFSKFGRVIKVEIPKKNNGLMCGFGFVVMSKAEEAMKAFEESKGLKFNGRTVKVDFVVDKSSDKDLNKKEKLTFKDNTETEIQNDDKSKFDNPIILDKNKKQDEIIKVKKNFKESFLIFVRNLSYLVTSESLKQHFLQFGAIKYALVVRDKKTSLSKGTGFIAFANESSYIECLKNAPSCDIFASSFENVDKRYILNDRILDVLSYLDKDSASSMAQRNLQQKEKVDNFLKDKRNLFLLEEGRITKDNPMSKLFSDHELTLRETSYQERSKLLKKNPMLHISLKRIVIKNIPRLLNSKALKVLALKSVNEFNKEAEINKKKGLTTDEIQRSLNYEKVNNNNEILKIKKNKSCLVIQLKIVMELNSQNRDKRSRGFGFVEFKDHKSALSSLRWLNGYQVSVDDVLVGLTEEEKKTFNFEKFRKKSLVVEFAIENSMILRQRKQRLLKQKLQSNNSENTEINKSDSNLLKKRNFDCVTKIDKKNDKNLDNDSNFDNVKKIISYKRRKKKMSVKV